MRMPKKISRKGFLKLLAVAPAVLLPTAVMAQEGYSAWLQIEDTAPFMPDGLYAAGLEFGYEGIDGVLKKTSNSFAKLHYVRDGIEYKEYYNYGAWVEGDNGPMFIAMDLL